MNIEEYMINRIREDLRWLVENTDVAWSIFEDEVTIEYGTEYGGRKGILFEDSRGPITTIWEDEA